MTEPDRLPVDQPLDFAERWMLDGLRVLRPAFSVLQVSVDMTQALQRLESLRRDGVHATSTHLLVLATARAFASNPDLHQMVVGAKRHRPRRVDIGLSVTGDAFITPVVVIEGADKKSVPEIAAEVARCVPLVRVRDQRMRAALKQWGWLVPFGFLRRGVLRILYTSAEFRRRGAGTFQISTIPGDWGLSSTFATSGLLVAGQVWSRVVAVGGQPAVRPMMTLTLSCDHGSWDGRAAGRLLATVKSELERA
jgi:pyruvate dehydrogenase E2 component (dihydrolipoamide acetyltransferase)